MKHKHFILFILLTMLSTAFARAQTSFDPKGGCLNVVDFSHGQKLGEYGDKSGLPLVVESDTAIIKNTGFLPSLSF